MNRKVWILQATIFFMIFAGFLVSPTSIQAECTATVQGGPIACTSANDYCSPNCYSTNYGTAIGKAYYSCGTYCWHYADAPLNQVCDSWGDGCYWNVYTCDTSCAAATPPGACFLPGTMVGNSSGGKRIEEIEVGDSVTSFADEKIVNSSVSEIFKTQRDFYFEIEAEGYGVSVTAEHPFYVGSGRYEETQNLKVGETLYVNENGELAPKQITSIRRIDEKTDVYNMSVDGTHTYFANGFGVHNKTSYVGPTCGSLSR